MVRRKKQRWVIKAGSNMVCSGGPLLVRAWMQQVAELRRAHNVEVIWVTSGAIASARARLKGTKINGKKEHGLAEKQALSAMGQPIVMDMYNLAVQTTGNLGAQVLLTSDDLADRKRRANFINTIEQLLHWGVLPILNENDAIATEEIRFGDNDSLSARVANHMGADRLIILTDVEGLFDSDPRKNPHARLIQGLEGISAQLLARTGRSSGTSVGTGGMYSKLKAAQEALKKGIETWLVKGDLPDVLAHVAADDSVGTRIRPKKRKRS